MCAQITELLQFENPPLVGVGGKGGKGTLYTAEQLLQAQNVQCVLE